VHAASLWRGIQQFDSYEGYACSSNSVTMDAKKLRSDDNIAWNWNSVFDNVHLPRNGDNVAWIWNSVFDDDYVAGFGSRGLAACRWGAVDSEAGTQQLFFGSSGWRQPYCPSGPGRLQEVSLLSEIYEELFS